MYARVYLEDGQSQLYGYASQNPLILIKDSTPNEPLIAGRLARAVWLEDLEVWLSGNDAMKGHIVHLAELW